MPDGWTEDAVPGWQRRTLPLDGGDVATLVRVHPGPDDGNPDPRPAVLLVHGYNDYVFQAPVATALGERGYACYGVDLRRCGRSRRPDQLAHYTHDLAEYQADLDAAMAAIRAASHPRVAVLAHSTGGLVAALWAAARASGGGTADDPTPTGTATGPDALVLNSPWFGLWGPWWRRAVAAGTVRVLGRVAPMRVVHHQGSAYQRHLHSRNGGRWDYDLALKTPSGVPVRAGWLRAVVRGQRRVARGLGLPMPVLVCTAAANGPDRDDNPELDRQDTVLAVPPMWRVAPRLGPDVTVVRIADGVHDLSLSADAPRARYLGTVLDWLDAHLVAPAVGA